MLGKFFGGQEKTKKRTLYYWTCDCGASSNGGDRNEYHAQYLAKQHQSRKGIGHPLPTVYSGEIDVPIDWP